MSFFKGTRWAGHVASMGESRDACRILVGRHGGRRPLDRRRIILEDNVKMIFNKWNGGREWIYLAQDRDK